MWGELRARIAISELKHLAGRVEEVLDRLDSLTQSETDKYCEHLAEETESLLAKMREILAAVGVAS